MLFKCRQKKLQLENLGPILRLSTFLLKSFRQLKNAGGQKPQHSPLSCHILAFCLPVAMSHNRSVFHATAFESSGNFYVFKSANLEH